MVHLQAIRIFQKQTFGEILARREERFENAMNEMERWSASASLTVKA